MAGTGKSTIARTAAHFLQQKGQLGASFFFKRSEAERANASRLVPTIAEQLMSTNPQMAPGIIKAIESDAKVSSKSLAQQFDTLLLQPLLRVKLHQNSNTVIVIDALDECNEEDMRILLRLLPQLQQSRSIRLRILLTSRPQPAVRHGFNQNGEHQDLILHELPSPVIERDIRLYLKHQLSSIQAEYSLPSTWAPDYEIEKLVAMSVPLFIFAATLCRFIGDGKRSPVKRLATVLQSEAATATSQMGGVYKPLLEQILSDEDQDESEDLVKEFRDIVGPIILLATPLSVHTLGLILSMPVEDIAYLLNKLQSVLIVPEDTDAPVRMLHLSFQEFLVKTESVFHVDERETHAKILSCCMRVMASRLKHNICGLSSYGTRRTDIEHRVLVQFLPPDLQYCCRYWVYHLEQGGADASRVET